MPGGLGLQEVVISFKFRQNRLNGFRDVGGRKLPFLILKASGLLYITACTTVQAVMIRQCSSSYTDSLRAELLQLRWSLLVGAFLHCTISVPNGDNYHHHHHQHQCTDRSDITIQGYSTVNYKTQNADML